MKGKIEKKVMEGVQRERQVQSERKEKGERHDEEDRKVNSNTDKSLLRNSEKLNN